MVIRISSLCMKHEETFPSPLSLSLAHTRSVVSDGALHVDQWDRELFSKNWKQGTAF